MGARARLYLARMYPWGWVPAAADPPQGSGPVRSVGQRDGVGSVFVGFRRQRSLRFIGLAGVLLVALVGCGSQADPNRAAEVTEPDGEVEAAPVGLALSGVQIEVHRDPG